MLIILSPAKKLDFLSPCPTKRFSQPEFLQESAWLVAKLKHLSPKEIARLMKLSDSLGELNVARYQSWCLPFNLDNARQALFAFVGDVYKGLDAYALSQKEVGFAQNYLRILSGLYGLLKPLDLIQPYRLEMGSSVLKKIAGQDLYQFWRGTLTASLNKILEENGPLINLASQEYFKVLDQSQIKSPIIHLVFKEFTKGNYQVIGIYAKRARGLMARHIISRGLTDPEAIKEFQEENYRYNAQLSTEGEWVFSRKG